MTKDEFRARLKGLGLSLTDFAILTGINRTTVNCWGGFRTSSFRDQEFPLWVPLLLAAWESDPSSILEAAGERQDIKLAVRIATGRGWAASVRKRRRERRKAEAAAGEITG